MNIGPILVAIIVQQALNILGVQYSRIIGPLMLTIIIHQALNILGVQY